MKTDNALKRNQPIVDLISSIGFGILISYPSGVTYTRQVGGYFCLQEYLEGVYIPFANDILRDTGLSTPEHDLYHYFTGPKWKGTGAVKGIDEQDIIEQTS